MRYRFVTLLILVMNLSLAYYDVESVTFDLVRYASSTLRIDCLVKVEIVVVDSAFL